MVEKLVGLMAVLLADKWAAMKELIDAHETVVPLVGSRADLMAVLMAHQ